MEGGHVMLDENVWPESVKPLALSVGKLAWCPYPAADSCAQPCLFLRGIGSVVPSYVLRDNRSTKLPPAYEFAPNPAQLIVPERIHTQHTWAAIECVEDGVNLLFTESALVGASFAHSVPHLASGGCARTTLFDSPACPASDARRPAYIGIASWSVHPWQDAW